MSGVPWDEAKRHAEEIRGWRLAEVRRNRSLTQREVADAMGVSGPRAYVEASGGRLKVTAEFDDSTYLVA